MRSARDNMALYNGWCELRYAAFASHSQFRHGPGSRAAIMRFIRAQIDYATMLEVLPGGGGVRAGIAGHEDGDSFFGCPIFLVTVDCDMGDAGAVAWVADRLRALAPTLPDHTELNLLRAHGALLPLLLDGGLHIEAAVLLGCPRRCLAGVGEVDPELPEALGIASAAVRNEGQIDGAIGLTRRFFSANPAFGWFLANEPYLAAHRASLALAARTAPRTHRVLLRGDEVVGFFGFDLEEDNPLWGMSAGMDVVLDPSLHGKGLGRWAYWRMLRQQVALGVRTMRGGTSNPAVLHLARRMGREVHAWELRRGPGAFPPEHFQV
jgi:GNAT superfamily N-acetyltransferase